MKTTMMFRPIANPRRTRLAALTDAEPQGQAELNTEVARAGEIQEFQETPETGTRPTPRQTANPRRTVLTELPVAASASAE